MFAIQELILTAPQRSNETGTLFLLPRSGCQLAVVTFVVNTREAFCVLAFGTLVSRHSICKRALRCASLHVS